MPTIQQVSEAISQWQPRKKLATAPELVDPSDPIFPLFQYLYNRVKKQARQAPPRKNGEPWFIHPVNVVLNLQKARVTDPLTFCIGLLHDSIEDEVDFYQEKHHIPEDKRGLLQMHEFQQQALQDLHQGIFPYTSPIQRKTLLRAVQLLTRQKQDFYPHSMSQVFDCPHLKLREQIIQVKLADRIHNIQCVASFSQEKRLYECFKNLFILNNAKRFLLDHYGKGVLEKKPFTPTERLFTQCCKTTYQAFLTVCTLSSQKGTTPVHALLELAFKKFAFEQGGIKAVTQLDISQKHPVRLYQGVVRKYHARLHQEKKKLEKMKTEEYAYCRQFFAKYHFSEEQLQSIIEYKDAYALKEIVAALLYDPTYVIQGFLTTQLREGRIPE